MTQPYDYASIAKMIDHSLLNPTLTTPELEEGCALAIRYNVASVCILPYALARCAALLAGTTVNASTTIGFPHGGHTTAIKLAEVSQALKDGGQELDAVINISKARSGDYVLVERTRTARQGEIVVALVHGAETTLKRFYNEGSQVRLQPANIEMEPIYVKASEVMIQGRVLGVLRKYR